jgi:cytoskeleton-associated protein 5
MKAIFRLLSLKVGFKDTNFQCNMEKFRIIAIAAGNSKLSQMSIGIVFDYCLDKIADVKCGALSKEALNSMSDSISLAYMAKAVLIAAKKLKNIKNYAEAWGWFSESLPFFGFGKLDVEMFRDESKSALASSNAPG